jgi:hypothetical protein
MSNDTIRYRTLPPVSVTAATYGSRHLGDERREVHRPPAPAIDRDDA